MEPSPSSVPSHDVGAPASVTDRFKAFRQKHHVSFELAFFFAGFVFDVVLLHRIDSTPLLIHQACYLVLSAVLIFLDHRLAVVGREPAGFWGKVASYRLWVMHFFLGTLLNAFMVFYFRASSGVLSLIFLMALAGLIIANESPRFRQQGPIVRVALLSFATTSFLAYLLPVVFGVLSTWQYYVAVTLGALVTLALWRLSVAFVRDPHWTVRRAVIPGLALQAALFLLYLVGAIPPVPLSLKHIGVYERVVSFRDESGIHYAVHYQPAPEWQFWRRDASAFIASPEGVCLARPKFDLTETPCLVDADCGSEGLCSAKRVWAFVRIFAPARFKDQVSFEWAFDDPSRGWVTRGKPYRSALSGGSEEGYRTFAYSTVDKAGSYRVRVLTEDGREIGRHTFEASIGSPPPARMAEE